ncbi:MAG: tRNA (adenosine(37)-N6)-dimethylallyltransferase MiaA [Desulfuromonadales bacterium]|nr:tRNA (adenosine(37)-N6)-dimethylallyltransferase MiaA [Desulfuromonadales bacterium]
MTRAFDPERPLLPVICGPTAVGKTDVAIRLAERFGGEIISADSRQIYRLMDIGTAKPTATELARARHHLIDLVWPDETFSAARFTELAATAIVGIGERGGRPLLVGGTGLYIRALTEGLLDAPAADPRLRAELRAIAESEGSAVLHRRLAEVDPVAAVRLHPNDLVRIERALEVHALTGRPLSQLQQEHAFAQRRYRTLKIGLDLDRQELIARIDRRATRMFAEGLLDETRRLLAAGYDPASTALRTIGYRQAVAVLRAEMTEAEALDDLQRATRRYAKQQLTWFRRDKSIIWLDSFADFATILKLIENFYDA